MYGRKAAAMGRHSNEQAHSLAPLMGNTGSKEAWGMKCGSPLLPLPGYPFQDQVWCGKLLPTGKPRAFADVHDRTSD